MTGIESEWKDTCILGCFFFSSYFRRGYTTLCTGFNTDLHYNRLSASGPVICHALSGPRFCLSNQASTNRLYSIPIAPDLGQYTFYRLSELEIWGRIHSRQLSQKHLTLFIVPSSINQRHYPFRILSPLTAAQILAIELGKYEFGQVSIFVRIRNLLYSVQLDVLREVVLPWHLCLLLLFTWVKCWVTTHANSRPGILESV
ncbi:hypothetical protein F4776DRAFT_35773 [Hypoxylon sp. NC0597]|nr:hypothetical protein F4776DRAFT_35773 [Hypoxylon sp. NC0597]